MPATAREMGVTDVSDPAQNLNGGAKYLAQQLRAFKGNLALALAAYNAGPGAVQEYLAGRKPLPAETIAYVNKIVAEFRKPIAQPAGAAERVRGLVAPGNIDLHHRPVVHNKDGTISTVRSITITPEGGPYKGKAVLIPTVVGNRVVSNREAVEHFRKTGQHLGIFASEPDADRYAQSLHEEQAHEYGRRG